MLFIRKKMGSNSTNSTRAKCTDFQMPFQYSLYATTYIIIFIPGLLANSAALWVLCRFISKKNKAIIFMINLSVADLAHVLSLPLRIYYYISHHWPFQRVLCLLCFYLKYLNMYASICFLTCISLQRCLFLLKPFRARNWKRRYDVGISAAIWVIVGTACLPLPILRSAGLDNHTESCFADLGLYHISMASSIGMVTAAELGGFVFPVAIITYCTWKTRKSLQESQVPPQNTKERKKALRMVLMCAVVFVVCFTPYHLNFPFFMMVKQDMFSNCSFTKTTLCFHIISLCLANLNCCLDPVVYYFMTSEFRDQFSEHSGLVLQSCVRCRDSALEIHQRKDDLQTISLECLDDSNIM
ncbi:putative P2Y purinoceptor 10 [Dipodomys spectabilis]|uniref:putative P2Y purinoceptor 10 n=1 Tax=Dipodomys spectabilis TaxID=105255 RepID=UPI001C541C73|nr:putative P2Y purinoceptor 10 [Dipodomys spectabilis]XP_042524191.1 putative P2Y purinoceptor 10 [Dipodomys spectabilis]XP_042524192.1 putative P2Y purinoceptor 10 [Dipodomys spectabilis]XP_042524193.1 putative P2Y purinoceptor 10 [Dipodomys spectabilis]XP_042524194.1 putative P2Y purinoceptor 10 [Dipodomys spectabilis]